MSIANKDTDDPVLSNFQKSGDLKCTVTNLKSSDIGIVVDISVIDSFLILSEHQTDLIFKVFSTKTGKLLSNSVRKGNGPDEINFPTLISEYKNDIFTMYDAGLKKLNFLSVNNMIKGNAKFLKSEKIPYAAFKTYPLNDSIFLSSGSFEEGRYSLYNKNNGKNKVMLDYPYDAKHKNESNLIKGLAFQGEIAIKPDLKTFVSTCHNSGSIEICGFHNNNLERVFRKDYFSSEYRVIEGNAAFSKSNRYAFHSPSVTDENIYVIYSGITAESPHYTAGKFLLVYDWSGTPLIYFNLDRGVTKMALDKRSNTIYCVSMNPVSYEDEIVSYKLPKL